MNIQDIYTKRYSIDLSNQTFYAISEDKYNDINIDDLEYENIIVEVNEHIDFSNNYNIKVIYFGMHLNQINQKLDKLAPNLKELRFGDDFNQNVDSLSELKYLEYLSFGTHFNQQIDNLPSSLIDLKLGDEFNQNINNLPPNLQSLRLGSNFNKSIDNLPQSLKLLTLECWFNQSLDNLPNSLEHLILDSYTFKHKVNVLPDNLENIYIKDHYDENDIRLTKLFNNKFIDRLKYF